MPPLPQDFTDAAGATAIRMSSRPFVGPAVDLLSGDQPIVSASAWAVTGYGRGYAVDMEQAPGQAFQIGTVVVVDDAGLVRPSAAYGDHRVVGVVTGLFSAYKPAFAAAIRPAPQRVLVAVAGLTECNVIGPIRVGDALTTSQIPGRASVAISWSGGTGAAFGTAGGGGGAHPAWFPGRMIGKALRSVDTGIQTRIPIIVALG